MADFDFDTPIERRGGDSIKWNRYAGRDVLPLWVADMDFAAPPAVLAALQRRTEHGVFGYAGAWPSLVEAVQQHLLGEYAWTVNEEWIVWLPGVVAGLNVACRATGEADGAVFSATPVYPPFLSAPGHSGRRGVTAPLVRDEEGWLWDWATTDAVLKRSGAKLFQLCHPHNPVGRAWSEDELFQLGALAEKHDLVVCSDEIHCGLVLDPSRRHKPFASLSPELAARSITLMAPSKTFNIPGLYCAFAVIPDTRLRLAFRRAMEGIMPHVNTLGLVACEAAYRDCGDWHRALLGYLRGNARCVEQAVGQMPGLSMTPVEATYLAWLDVRELGLEQPHKFFEEYGVGLSDGRDFGLPGYLRLNFGCSQSTLEEALARIARAVAARQ